MGSHNGQTAGGPRRATERSCLRRGLSTNAAILKRLADRGLGIDEPIAGIELAPRRGTDV
jgi:hypothetical protein